MQVSRSGSTTPVLPRSPVAGRASVSSQLSAGDQVSLGSSTCAAQDPRAVSRSEMYREPGLKEYGKNMLIGGLVSGAVLGAATGLAAVAGPIPTAVVAGAVWAVGADRKARFSGDGCYGNWKRDDDKMNSGSNIMAGAVVIGGLALVLGAGIGPDSFAPLTAAAIGGGLGFACGAIRNAPAQ